MRFKLIENILLEDIEAVKKRYPDIDEETFMTLIAFDPTYDENRNSVGTYGKWILDRWKKGNISEQDFGHLNDVLTRFHKNKTKIQQKDINKFKTPEELDNYLNDESNYTTTARQQKRQNVRDRNEVDIQRDADLVYEDNQWEVWVPKTYAASCRLGSGSNWCTANTNSDYYYNYYKNQFGGNYYINISKQNPSEKYQFHFESGQFMDKDDRRIDLEKFLNANAGLKAFYKKQIDNEQAKVNISTYNSLYGQQATIEAVANGKVSATVEQYFQYLGKDYALEKILDGTLDISNESLGWDGGILKLLPTDFFTDSKYDKAARKFLNANDNAMSIYEFYHNDRCHPSYSSAEKKEIDNALAEKVDMGRQIDNRNWSLVYHLIGDRLFEDKALASKMPKDINGFSHQLLDNRIGGFACCFETILMMPPYRKQFNDLMDKVFAKGRVLLPMDADKVDSDYAKKILLGELGDEYSYQYSGQYSFDNFFYERDDINDSVKEQLKEMGLPEDVFDNMDDYEEDFDNDEEYAKYDPEELKDAFTTACENGNAYGASEEATNSFKNSLDTFSEGISVDWQNSWGSDTILFIINKDILKDTLFIEYLCNQIDDNYVVPDFNNPKELTSEVMDAAYDYIKEEYEFETPYYGWDGWSEDAFNDDLSFRLGELEPVK